MSDHPKILDSERSVFERPTTIKIIWAVLIVGCIGFAAINFWLRARHDSHHKAHFEDMDGPMMGLLGGMADGFPAFYAVVGFVSFSFIVLAGQHLRRILMRPEGYYDGAEAERPRNPVADDQVVVTDMDTGEGRDA